MILVNKAENYQKVRLSEKKSVRFRSKVQTVLNSFFFSILIVSFPSEITYLEKSCKDPFVIQLLEFFDG